MLEIIPNWHPVLVHFTIGLFATATGLFCLGTVFIQKSWGETVLKAAHINLWIGAAITVLIFHCYILVTFYIQKNSKS